MNVEREVEEEEESKNYKEKEKEMRRKDTVKRIKDDKRKKED